jgi:hypothetical protein
MLCLFVNFIYVMFVCTFYICYICLYILYMLCLFVCLFKSASTETVTIAFDPSFGSFTLSELVSLVKVFLDSLDWNGLFLVFRVWTQQVKCTTSYLLAGPMCL